eukprot:9218843-Pyramimonas_sp.AAC.1
MNDNILELEYCAPRWYVQRHCLKAGLIFYDVRAAFLSLLHEAMFATFDAMGVPPSSSKP